MNHEWIVLGRWRYCLHCDASEVRRGEDWSSGQSCPSMGADAMGYALEKAIFTAP